MSLFWWLCKLWWSIYRMHTTKPYSHSHHYHHQHNKSFQVFHISLTRIITFCCISTTFLSFYQGQEYWQHACKQAFCPRQRPHPRYLFSIFFFCFRYKPITDISKSLSTRIFLSKYNRIQNITTLSYHPFNNHYQILVHKVLSTRLGVCRLCYDGWSVWNSYFLVSIWIIHRSPSFSILVRST